MTEAESAIRKYMDKFGYIHSFVFKNMTNEQILKEFTECIENNHPFEINLDGIDPDDDL